MKTSCRILAALVCAWSISAAAQSPSVTDVDRVRLNAGELAELLGVPAPERDLGRPAAVDRALLAAIRDVHTEPGELPRLKMEVDGRAYDLPLEHTAVDIRVSGHAARVQVKQTFKNPLPNPLEAIYIFPLPENSAVHGMRMVIGERVIEAEIRKRQEARQEYDDAKRAGHTAALLEQERPNVFTQSVANIPARESIEVVIDYAQLLTYDSGEYEVVFPMVVGPRFNPGRATGTRRGVGWGEDTDQVRDASRITPPVVGGGFRSGHDISLEVRIEAGFPISWWDVPTHDIDELGQKPTSLHLGIGNHDRLPNRDFILRYRVAKKEPQVTLLTHRPAANGERSFTMILQPPELDIDRLVGRRELIFVVDVSGSMHGVPLSLSKDAMRAALAWMRPVDTFNVVTFSGSSRVLFESPLPANDTNVRSAIELVDGLRAGGGTMMATAVQTALKPEVEEGRHRFVVFLTDGNIGNETEIFSLARNLVNAARERGQLARVFSFGSGSSTNRHLLAGLAAAGNGIEMVASTRQDPAREINRLFRVIDKPILSDIQVDWGDVRVSEVFPEHVPDAFASRPWILHGKIRGEGKARIRVSGRANGRLVELPLEVHLSAEVGDPVQTTLWARAKVASLEQRLAYDGHDPDLVGDITTVGLQHDLVTAYTSFVAVDRSRRVHGESETVVQPVEAPEGVDPHMAGARVLGPPPHGAMASVSNLKAVRVPGGKGYRVSGLLGRLPRNNLSVGGGGGGGNTKGGAALLRGGGGGGGLTRGKAREVRGVVRKNPKAMRSIGHGTLSRDAIQKVINAHIGEIQRCYERELLRSPGLSGKLQIEWTIGADGRVKKVRVRFSSLKNTRVANCIVRAIKRWKFPKPHGGEVVVNYPFIFQAVGF